MKMLSGRTFLLAGLMSLMAVGCMGKGTRPKGYAPPPAKQPPAVPQTRAVRLDEQLREKARAELATALESRDGRLRANAVELLREIPDPSHHQQIVKALGDREAGVRGVAALAAGDLKLKEAQPALLKLVNDPNILVQISVRYALHRLGITRYTHDLETTARDPEWAVRGQTAMVLGLLQERSGLKILQVLRRDPHPAVRQQAIEAMWRLGSEEGRTELIGFTASRFADDQMIAIQGLAGPRDYSVRDIIKSMLTTDYLEVNLTAARALGQLDSDRGYTIAMRAATGSDPLQKDLGPDPKKREEALTRQKFLAARALGAIGRSDSQDVLRKLLSDPAERVRLAAAGAILQLKEPK